MEIINPSYLVLVSQMAHFCKVGGSLRKEERLGIQQAKFYLIPALKH